MIQSWENGEKPQFGQCFDDFQVKISPNGKLKVKLSVIFSTNFRSKTKKVVRDVFEKNIKVPDFGLIWRPFRGHLQIKNFFKNPALSLFYLYSPLTSCKKSEKSWESFPRKRHYQPTNQPTKYRSVWFWANLETFSRISPNQEFFSKIFLSDFSTFIVL